MKLEEFGYTLPEELIAQFPVKKRDESRLLVVRRSDGTITHDQFKNIDRYLPEQSHLVFNESKVIPARLLGRRSSGTAEVEIFLLKKLGDGYSYEALMRPLKRLKVGEKIFFDQSKTYAEVVDKEKRIVRFNRKNIKEYLEKNGHIPLPPYIKRDDEKSDRSAYQTVYAKNPGSVAAPTAGFHFTDDLIRRLKKQKHKISKLTLHINYGTFKPVEAEDITKHVMHFEPYAISSSVWRSLKSSQQSGQKIVAVGTTSCRVLEAVAHNGVLKGETNIFIYPGYDFRMVDCLITNFHLPYSTLLMLVKAFAGAKLMDKAYQEAIKEKYRFYSYGDGMLIL